MSNLFQMYRKTRNEISSFFFETKENTVHVVIELSYPQNHVQWLTVSLDLVLRFLLRKESEKRRRRNKRVGTNII